MKIVCDSCGAKYSIADEKVAGKVFKIRCKKCSAVIVVRGDQVGAEEQQDQATAVYDYGSDAIWHVVVDGDQQGPFTPPQIGEMLTAGSIDWEAYVWREGFDGWMAARDVPELVEAVTGQPQDQGGGEAAAAGAGAVAAGGAMAAAGADAMGADPFGGRQDQAEAGYDQGGFDQAQAGYDQGGFDQAQAGYDQGAAAEGGMFGAAGFGGEQEVASRASHDAGADLFAQSDAAASPFGGVGDAADDDVVASQPSPRVSADQASMTGQRNENSVLFSLSNLQALATGSSSGSTPAPAPSPSSSAKPGHASGEGSGLIDIRALASTANVGGGQSNEKANVDDLLSIGTGPSFGSSLGAPVLAPVQEEKSNKGLLIGLAAGGGVLAVAAIIVVVIFVTKEPEPVAQASGAPNAAGAVVPSTGGGEGAGDEGSAGGGDEGGGAEAAAAAAGADEGTDEGTDEGAEEEGDVEEDDGSSRSARRRRAARRRSGSSGGSSGSSSSEMESSGSSSSGSSGGGGGGGGGGGDIDSLLDRALGGMGGGSTRMRSRSSGGGGGGGSDLPETPPRDAVARALRSVAGAVARCGQGQSGVANTTVTVSGSTGRVTNAQVTGQFAGTPVGSCVARAVRGARFPRFSRSTFQVSFPYRI